MKRKRDHKVYKYTNKVNGKVYIGRTCQSLEKRAGGRGQGYKRCTLFWRAIQKYGWENFKGEILEEGLSAKEVIVREAFYIEQYDSTNDSKGYNILEQDYVTCSEEMRGKISSSLKGHKPSPETIEKLRKANTGRKASEETKRKMSESRKGRTLSKETIEKLRKANTGKKRTDEVKKKLSEIKLGKYAGEKCYWWGKHHSEETKEKLRKANSGRKVREDVKERISRTLKGRPAWNKGKKMSSETCKKMSESKKGEKNCTNKRIKCIETGEEYYSITYAAECTGIGMKNISYVLNKGPKHTAGGFHWVYVNIEDNEHAT